MNRFLITILVFASFALSGNCDEHGVQIPAPLQRYSREKLAVRLTQFPSDSDHTKYKVTEKELWSKKWKPYCGEQTLTEPQFLEMTGCFELAQKSRELHASREASTTFGTILVIAGVAATSYGALFYYEKHEIARVGQISVEEKKKTPANGFTFGGIAAFAIGFGISISEAPNIGKNLITYGDAQSLADKYNYSMELLNQSADSNRVRP